MNLNGGHKMNLFAKIALTTFVSIIHIEFAAAFTEFKGTACITKVNEACYAEGLVVGHCARARLRPAINDDNKFTSLSFHWGWFSQNFSRGGVIWDDTFQDVDYIIIGHGGSTWPAEARLISQEPADPSDSETVQMSGAINKFINNSTCNVEFYFTGQRPPEEEKEIDSRDFSPN